MQKKLILFGVGIQAKVVHFYFKRDTDFEIAAFTVDRSYMTGDRFCNLPVVAFEDIEKTYNPTEYAMFIAVGTSKMNAVREKKYHEARQKGYRLATYISPHAVCDSPIGDNTFVADQVVICPFATLGNNNFFWEHCYIGNDSTIGNNCSFSPHSAVGTFAIINDNTILGTGAIIKTSVNVARKTLVGAGCYLSKDTQEKGVYGEKSSPLYGCISDKINISA